MRSKRAAHGGMEARVLGPITVIGRSGPVEPGGHKLRLLLALLVSRVGQVVTNDQLIDGLWGDEPPSSARKALQVHVSNLRRNIGDGFPLRTVPGGYVIDTAAIEVDAVGFEHDVEAAGAALATDPGHASRILRDALARWNGPAYADVAGEDSMRAEATRLDELRLRAIEQRIDADLQLGLHDEVLGELQTLTIDHPYHERFRLQHMLALYRAGRQADALRVYRRTRELLVEELGVDPSPELAKLHQAILTQSPDLDVVVGHATEGAGGEGTAALRGGARTGRVSATPHPGALRGYELREPVVVGCGGATYRAYQASVAREVALEVVGPTLANDPEFIRRFETDCRIAARLEHPHIAPLLDYWRDPEGAYRVTPWLRGGTVATALERGRWRPPVAVGLVEQVGASLGYAHSHGVVHGDLQPDDVLLDEDGNGYVARFGVGLRRDDLPGRPGRHAPYRAPEVVDGAEPGRAADVYSLALLTFELLTTDRPPTGGSPAPVEGTDGDLPSGFDDLIARATDHDPALRFADVDDYLRALRLVFGAGEPVSGSPAETAIRNPYKGLRAFEEGDAEDFFGRDRLLAELIEHVRTNPLTVVVGPSGCGKSSLVRAGLVPLVRAGELFDDRTLVVTEMFPGSYPFEELEAALLRVAVVRPTDMLDELSGDAHGLMRVSKQILPADGTELLLVIDQFEELFLQTTDAAARELFLANLTAVAADLRGRVRLVLTLRADHFDRPLARPGFGGLLRDSLVTVAAPSDEELVAVITGPAANASLEPEPGLVRTILRDVPAGPASLPMLEYSLTELVETSPGRRLTIDGYERTGGVVGALARRAETIFEGLTPADREAAREILLRLVAVHGEGDDTRRRVRRTELAELGLAEERVSAVIGAFGVHRLLTFDRDPVTRGPTVEVAHEALLREWPRYRTWIDDHREDLLLERRLAAAVAEWVANDRDVSLLFRRGHLERYETWASRDDVRLTGQERAFLAESRRAEDAQSAAAMRRRRIVLVALSVLALVAGVFAVVAVAQRNRADDLRLEAEAAVDRLAARTLAAQSLAADDADVALILAIDAGELVVGSGVDDPTVSSALYQAVLNRETVASIDDVEYVREPWIQGRAVGQPFSSDGERIVLADGEDGLAVVDLDSGHQLVTMQAPGELEWVWWDDATGAILTGGKAGIVRWWDAETGAEIDARAFGETWVHPLASAGESLVLIETTARWNEPARIFAVDLGSGLVLMESTFDPGSIGMSTSGDHFALFAGAEMVRVYRTDDWTEVSSFAWSRSDPPSISSDQDRHVPSAWVVDEEQLWLLDERGAVARVDALTGVVLDRIDVVGTIALAADPRGGLLAVLARDEVALVDTEDEVVVAVLPVPFLAEWLVWTPDGRRLAAMGRDELLVWEMTMSPSSPDSIWPGVDFLPFETAELVDGDVVLASRSGAVAVTDRGGAISWEVSSQGETAATSVTSADGTSVVSSGRDAVEVRNAFDGQVRAVGPSGFRRPLAVSADGNSVVVATSRDPDDGVHAIGFVDGVTGDLISTVGSYLVGEDAVFIGDGTTALIAFERIDAAGRLGSSALWVVDVATGQIMVGGPDEPCISAVATTSDDRFAAIGGCDGTVSLYELDALLGEQPWTARIGQTPPGRAVVGVAFDERGDAVVASYSDGRIAAWSVDDAMAERWSFDLGNAVGAPRVDGDTLWLGLMARTWPADRATGGVVGLPLDQTELLDFARGKVVRELTRAECQRYLGGPCSDR